MILADSSAQTLHIKHAKTFERAVHSVGPGEPLEDMLLVRVQPLSFAGNDGVSLTKVLLHVLAGQLSRVVPSKGSNSDPGHIKLSVSKKRTHRSRSPAYRKLVSMHAPATSHSVRRQYVDSS